MSALARRWLALRQELAARARTKGPLLRAGAVQTGGRRCAEVTDVLNAVAARIIQCRQILLFGLLSVIVLPDAVVVLVWSNARQILAPISSIV